MTETALYGRVVAAAATAFGRSVHPHLFRDCAVTSLAERGFERLIASSSTRRTTRAGRRASSWSADSWKC